MTARNRMIKEAKTADVVWIRRNEVRSVAEHMRSTMLGHDKSIDYFEQQILTGECFVYKARLKVRGIHK